MTKPRKYLVEKPVRLDLRTDWEALEIPNAQEFARKNVIRKALMDIIHLPCKIRPKQRPRMGKNGRVYSPKGNQADLLNMLATSTILDHSIPPRTGIIIDRYYATKYPLKPSTPFLSGYGGDIDNLDKALFDAMQEVGILENDSFIVGGEAYKYYAPTSYCQIYIYEADILDIGTLKRMADWKKNPKNPNNILEKKND